jgi:hypothetical protein
MSKALVDKKIEVSSREYNLLKAAYEQLKKQAAILRIFEAEENLKKGKVKTVPFEEFVKNI